jgi:hypothetical protein
MKWCSSVVNYVYIGTMLLCFSSMSGRYEKIKLRFAVFMRIRALSSDVELLKKYVFFVINKILYLIHQRMID